MMAKRRSKRSEIPEILVDFESPPVTEVVCGVGFPEIPDMLIPHVGLWWAQHRKEFPEIRKADVILGFAEGNKLPSVGRTMFASADGENIVQIQQTRFYYNWVKSKNEKVYPHFVKIFDEFKAQFEDFCGFISKHGLGNISPNEYNLTYVNIFDDNYGWSDIRDIRKFLPDLSWRITKERKYFTQPSSVNFRFVFPIRDLPGNVTVTAQEATRRTGNDNVLRNVLRLELAAKATSPDGLEPHSNESMSAWFNTAREAIVLGFLDLTDEEIQITLWGRKVLNG